MKKTSIICIILAALMIVPFMASCSKKEVYSNVSIVFQEPVGEPDENGKVTYDQLFEYELQVKGTIDNPPTVLQAAEQALGKFEKDYELSKDGTYIASVFGHTEKERADAEVGYYDFWEATVNGEKSSDGRQSETVIYDGDKIVYTWTSGQKARQDTDAVVTTDPNEDTTVPVDETTAPETDEID